MLPRKPALAIVRGAEDIGIRAAGIRNVAPLLPAARPPHDLLGAALQVLPTEGADGADRADGAEGADGDIAPWRMALVPGVVRENLVILTLRPSDVGPTVFREVVIELAPDREEFIELCPAVEKFIELAPGREKFIELRPAVEKFIELCGCRTLDMPWLIERLAAN